MENLVFACKIIYDYAVLATLYLIYLIISNVPVENNFWVIAFFLPIMIVKNLDTFDR